MEVFAKAHAIDWRVHQSTVDEQLARANDSSPPLLVIDSTELNAEEVYEEAEHWISHQLRTSYGVECLDLANGLLWGSVQKSDPKKTSSVGAASVPAIDEDSFGVTFASRKLKDSVSTAAQAARNLLLGELEQACAQRKRAFALAAQGPGRASAAGALYPHRAVPADDTSLQEVAESQAEIVQKLSALRAGYAANLSGCL